MQISQSNPIGYRSGQSVGRVRFGKGKVCLYSDFDGTYFPGREEELAQKPAYFREYFKRFGDFIQMAGRDLEFNLTTGRDLHSVRRVMKAMEREKIPMAMPNALVVQDGGDEFLKATSKSGKGFAWRGVNQSRRDALVNATGWDAGALRGRLKDLFKQEGKAFQEEIQDTEGHSLPAERWGDGELVAWIRQEGPFLMKLHVKREAFPVLEEWHQKFEKAAGPSVHTFEFYDRHGKADLGLKMKPMVGHLVLSKHHDLGRAVEQAERRNDLVVAAGDWHNDFTMLNPANYIPELRQFGTEPKRLREAIDQSPDLQARLKKLPFMAVAVYGEHGLDESLKPLVEAYGDGPWRKIIPVAKGELVAGVQQAVREYRLQNPHYAAHVAPGIKVALGEEIAVAKRQSMESMRPGMKPSLLMVLVVQAFGKWLGKLLKAIGEFLVRHRFPRFERLL